MMLFRLTRYWFLADLLPFLCVQTEEEVRSEGVAEKLVPHKVTVPRQGQPAGCNAPQPVRFQSIDVKCRVTGDRVVRHLLMPLWHVQKFTGNRPSLSILLPNLTPYTVGQVSRLVLGGSPLSLCPPGTTTCSVPHVRLPTGALRSFLTVRVVAAAAGTVREPRGDPGLCVGHQQLRPVGRGAGQGAGQAGPDHHERRQERGQAGRIRTHNPVRWPRLHFWPLLYFQHWLSCFLLSTATILPLCMLCHPLNVVPRLCVTKCYMICA